MRFSFIPSLSPSSVSNLFQHVCFSEAPCKHLVELARAEVEVNPVAGRHMRDFASVRLDDAEVGVHKVLQRAKMTAPIPIEGLDIGEVRSLKQFPFIRLSSWMQLLLDSGRFARQMAGVPTIEKMRSVMTEFWRRYKDIHPDHFIFDWEADGRVQLQDCVPFFSHTDEGRSYKHMPIWILSSHGALGRGTRSYLSAGKHRAPLRRNGMGMNYIGKTWSTNFVFAAVTKTVSVVCPNAIPKLVAEYASDVQTLLETGLRSKDGQTHVRLVHLNTKGDLPALVKLGGLKRSFSNVPRGPSSKKSCQGICHLCLGGREADPSRGVAAVPFEDLSASGQWTTTIGVDLPWDSEPAILTGLPLTTPFEKTQFFSTDFWHNCHLGVCKHFTACSFVAVLESGLSSVPNGSMEVKFQWLTDCYKGYFRSMNKTPFIAEISRDTMNFPAGTANPIGKWSKGQVSTEMMMFLDFFGRNFIVGKTVDPLLTAIVSCSVWHCVSSFGCVFMFPP